MFVFVVFVLGVIVSGSHGNRVARDACRPGFRPSADPRECEDINECDSYINPCEHTCTNTRGSYTCSCRSGYVVSSSDPSRCSSGGSTCRPGFRPSADPRECEDINECDSSTPPCEHTCTNTRGSYTCSCRSGYVVSSSDPSRCSSGSSTCNPGFRPSSDPRECEDINECDSSTPPCEHTCTNTRGSYTCSCRSGYVVSSSNPTRCTSGGSTCNPGFRPSSDPRECEDINECDSSTPPCEHTCTNTRGSYTCSCRSGYVVSSSNPTRCTPGGSTCQPGFRPSSDPRECEDINECDSSTPPCEQTCTNTRGSYKCSCRSGYVISSSDPTRCTPGGNTCQPGFRPSSDPRECEDINECDSSTPPCEQTCTNTRGSYTCSCRSGYVISSSNPTRCTPLSTCLPGFQPSSDPRECEDINECSNTINPPCQQECTNTRGSYKCSCRAGYAVSLSDPSKCEDIDECTQITGSPCDQVCTNNVGSFQCSCKKGYRVSSTNPNKCEDVNECSGSSSPCQQTCTNTQGSYTCSCNDGFAVSSTDSTKCESVDQCLKNPCQHICTGTGTGFKCSCKKGYWVSSSDSTKCEDIDECTQASGSPCAQVCTNNVGSFQCSCKKGYRVSASDPNKCEDVNECSGSSNPCQQTCTNTQGSYTCSCNDGFAVSSTDSTKCESVDQCLKNTCQHICTGTGTGFKCSCKKGYQISASDSTKCEDIDECTQSSGSPCAQVCTNNVGSFQCSCKKGYRVSASDPNKCEDINECSSGSPCAQNCTNTEGSFKCSCTEGFAVSATDKTKCEGTDPCAKKPCEHTCTSTGTGFKCTCKKGYAVSKTDPNKCEDIDECSNKPCEFQCTNTKGSYTCTCPEGSSPSQKDKTKCESEDFCSSKPKCEHICTLIPGDRKCSCREGYVVNDEDNTLCDEIELCKTKADIIMLFDASNSIPPEHFVKQFDFAKRLSKNFKIGPNDVRWGGLVFSRYTELLFNLKDHNDYAGLDKALTGVKFMNSSTYTNVAFDYVNNNTMFGVDNGGRDDAPDIVLLFTDGNPTYNDRAYRSADVLKSKGAVIIGLGIGTGIDMDVLRKMTSEPDDAIEASSYEMLEYVEKRLASLLCSVQTTR